MRTNATHEQRVAVVEQMMCGDRRRDVLARRCDELGGIGRRDVLEHDAQPRPPCQQGLQHRFDEDVLAVEDVDRRIGNFAMHEQRHARLFHLGERHVALGKIGHPCVGVGRRPGRIELDRLDEAAVGRAPDLVGRRVVSEVKRHQWLETRTLGQHGENALAIRAGGSDGRHRRTQVGHDNRPRELRRAVRQNGLERVAVTQVQMPVVGTRQGDSGEGGGLAIGHDEDGRRNACILDESLLRRALHRRIGRHVTP